RPAGPAGGGRGAGPRLRAVRHRVVPVPDPPDGRAPGEPAVLPDEPPPVADVSERADERRVAFLGGGRMGEALASGLTRSGGRSVGELTVTCRREERAREVSERTG